MFWSRRRAQRARRREGELRLGSLAFELHLVLPKPTSQTGRPDVRTLLEEAVEETSSGHAGESIGVVASAPDAMNRDVNNACASMAWEGRDVRVMVEKFGW